MVASFIIHYFGWQARNRFLGHLSEIATIAQVDCRAIAFLDPFAFYGTDLEFRGQETAESG